MRTGTLAFVFLVFLMVPHLPATELVTVDAVGVIRWQADQSEVALFGANYCLPSACDYRAAGYVNADRKKLVEKDLAHFARLGWDAMRLCLWGDWENSDAEGNLLVNDHLDVMDYAIAQAKQRGIYILFSPITTYASWWPDGKPSPDYPGFSNHFEKSKLGTDPAAIAAQQNYLRQILAHVNPYTGVALKDEPQILFVEMINEPWHHADDLAGSVAYINALVDAVRSTGCEKILFHNVSQDMDITPAIKASQVQGVTFAWYPTGLNVGRTLDDNHLRSVDAFTPMLRPDLLHVPKIVYEFDSPDVNSGYMYPAMVRAFRGVGAQFATMFSYDMLDTAPYNLGWQTHFLNLVYSPRKAVSAIIAAEAMRRLPRYSAYGDYPANTRFGAFRVSYEEDLGELAAVDVFMFANDTSTTPPDLAQLRRVVGAGSSPVVGYEGNGAYFLDRLADGVWRLEVYPDAVLVQDPFAQRLNYQSVSSRLIWRTWPMAVHLPDLGEAFAVSALDAGNSFSTTAKDGRFGISPGVYLLSRTSPVDRASLPAMVGRVGLTEFVCPRAPVLPPQILPDVPAVLHAGRPATLAVEVIDATSPRSVKLEIKSTRDPDFRPFLLTRRDAYWHAITLPGDAFPAGPVEYYFEIETAAGPVRWPTATGETLTTHAVKSTAPLPLFDAASDIPQLVYTRVGDTVRRGIFQSLPATDADPAALRLMFPLNLDRTLDDYTASLAIKARVRDRGGDLAGARSLHVKMRGKGEAQPFYVTLVESDGTAWSRRLEAPPAWTDITFPLAGLRLARGVMLPLGYPGRWDYWLTPAQGRGGADDKPRLDQVERVQISFRPDGPKPRGAEDTWVDIALVEILME